MANISHRVSIRWPPAAASEPTSTIVLTSPQRRFVDVRFLLPLPPATATSNETASADTGISADAEPGLDWAFAGTASYADGDDDTHRSVWRHWVDSRTADAEQVVDEGDMEPLEDGTTLETGAMVDPATGERAPYEEVWENIEAASSGGEESSYSHRPRYVVLQLQGDKAAARGVVIRLGQYCQGVLRIGDRVTAERWQQDPETRAWASVRVGADALPLAAAVDETRKLGVGDTVTEGAWAWTVVETC